MLTLQSCHADDDKSALTAHYRLTHSRPGRGGTTLELNVRVVHAFGRVTADITDLAPRVETTNTEEALDKLAEWLERAAAGLRARGKPAATLPLQYEGS